jgi:hypothetical protein
MEPPVTDSEIRVDVARWPGCGMPRREIQAALTYLALKARKPVYCVAYQGEVHYNTRRVQVYVPHLGTRPHAVPVAAIRLKGTEHPLHENQRGFPEPDAAGVYLRDEAGIPLARVDGNCVVFMINFAAINNAAGGALLAHVVEQAVPHLDFDVTARVQQQQQAMREQYAEFHRSAIRSRIDSRAEESRRLEAEARRNYYELIEAERQLPLVRQELDLLHELAEQTDADLVEKQARNIAELIDQGYYEKITTSADGSLFARTGIILIEHDGWVFDMGRYTVHIDRPGQVLIESADEVEGDGYPHPHIDGSGRPCLGNISADLARALAAMRVAEALTLIHEFVSSYNAEGAYVRIGKFDSNYPDNEENRCVDCEDYRTPFCIMECSENQGDYGCSDCCEYRTDFCYTECGYNQPDYNCVSPCDACEESDEYCYTECPYNERWRQRTPCAACRENHCTECDYREQREALGLEPPNRVPAS